MAVDLKPTAGMAESARTGLRLHNEGKSGDGLKPETVRRANIIAARQELTEDHVREMNAWFARHEADLERKHQTIVRLERERARIAAALDLDVIEELVGALHAYAVVWLEQHVVTQQSGDRLVREARRLQHGRNEPQCGVGALIATTHP